MKYRALALTTAVAMTASLFAIPIHAEDTTINITEIDLDNAVIDLTDGAAPTFTGKLTLKTDNDEKITITSSTEDYSEMEKSGENSYSSVAEVTNAKYTLKDQNGNEIPTFSYFSYKKQYMYSLDEMGKLATGYTFATYSSHKATTKIPVYVNGVENKYIGVEIEMLPDSQQFYVFVNRGLLTPTSKDGTMFRLYNPNTGEHFYTSSGEEREIDIAAGWNYEGIGWIAPTSGTPVMRMYNPVAGEHHYTTNKDEADNLVAAGWNLESDCAWYSAPAETGAPLYREYNPNQYSCNHNYTTSQEENDMLVNAGWQYEGIAWYGLK